MADGTQRRRARDRNPQGYGKKVDQRPQIIPPPVRPLTINPLRPSGPIRRTCGVIKLPVMLLSPPSGDVALRDSILGQQGVVDQKSHSLNVVVQSLWEKRLQTVNPRDHLTGEEITRQELQQQTVISRPDPAPIDPSAPPQQPSPPIPSLLSSQQLPGGTSLHSLSRSSSPQTGLNSNRFQSISSHSSPLTGTKLLQQVHQLKSLPSSSPSPPTISAPPTLSAPHIPQCVTDTDVILQEQRVQLLRQQLMAAQSGL